LSLFFKFIYKFFLLHSFPYTYKKIEKKKKKNQETIAKIKTKVKRARNPGCLGWGRRGGVRSGAKNLRNNLKLASWRIDSSQSYMVVGYLDPKHFLYF
jgi:hypothetical protein